MLFRKYNVLNRNQIIICPAELEDFSNAEYDDEYIVTILKDKYNNDYFETPPYHYIVSKNAIIQIKHLDLQHNDSGYLKSFNDDIKILLLNDYNIVYQKDNLVELISDLSATYSLNISSSLVYARNHNELSLARGVDDLAIESIKRRNEKKPVMAVSEAVVDGEIIINNSIIPVSNRLNFTTLLHFSNQYSIPIATLNMLNPHLVGRQLVVSDTIFLPKTVATSGIIEAGIAKKMAQYYYDKSRQLIENGGVLNG